MESTSSRRHAETAHLDALLMDRLISQLAGIEQRLASLESGSAPASASRPALQAPRPGHSDIGALRSEIDFLRSELYKVNDRAASMRLDRQIRLASKRGLTKLKSSLGRPNLPSATGQGSALSLSDEDMARRDERRRKHADHVQRLMTLEADVIIVSHVYPGGRRAYGGQFIQTRVLGYKDAGLNVAVIEADPYNKSLSREVIDGVDILRVNLSGLDKALELSRMRILGVHFPERPIWDVIKFYAKDTPILAWVHGYEARDWRELEYNFTEAQRRELRPRLDRANSERRATLREMFAHRNVTMVFVSEYMKGVAEKFVGAKAPQSVVIHNPILQSQYRYRPKSAEDRKRILWVRSFDAHNYSNDLSRDFVLALSRKPYFKDVAISIFGDGKHFEAITQPLRRFENVTIQRRFLTRDEMAEQHRRHGVMLVPTRWDSQGLTAGEAMSSGLVPLTTKTAAIPEFIDSKSGFLTPYNSYRGLVKGYDKLYKNPELFLSMSRIASERSQKQCGRKATISWEVALLKEFMRPVVELTSSPVTLPDNRILHKVAA